MATKITHEVVTGVPELEVGHCGRELVDEQVDCSPKARVFVMLQVFFWIILRKSLVELWQYAALTGGTNRKTEKHEPPQKDPPHPCPRRTPVSGMIDDQPYPRLIRSLHVELQPLHRTFQRYGAQSDNLAESEEKSAHKIRSASQ